MCGLCGVAGFGNETLVAAMTAKLAHRGPDDEGVEFLGDAAVGMGFRRLSIVDLSSEGHQPMAAEDGSVVLVYNGEIYNFRDLRTELESKGERFRSTSDTEVILRLYMREGPAAIHRLNGMFAVAILDRSRKSLLLARDRLGVKPLYYAARNGRFAFASEIKAILESGLVSTEIDRQAMFDYFTYLYVPCPATIFAGIRQVPPAHVLEIDLEDPGRDPLLTRYWTPDGDAETADPADPGALRALLGDAVRRQMISDVPLGLFLSGGIDSTILAGLMAEAATGPVETFTVGFEGPDFVAFDERNLARQVAKGIGANHHEVPVRIDDPFSMLSLVESFDQPFGNPTFLLMHLVSRASRPDVKVALCGAGGDELFAGYPRYRAEMLARRLRFLPSGVVRGSASLLAPFTDNHRTMALRRARELLEGWDADSTRRFMNWTYFASDEDKRLLLRSVDGLESSKRILDAAFSDSGAEDSGNRMLEADLRTFLVDNVLEYTDKMSMAVGLEVRVPYLDHRVVELAMRIPFREKLRGGRTKIALKQACRDLLPQAVVDAPKKGFNLPLALWMARDLDGYFDRFMDEDRVVDQGFFNREQLKLLRMEHLSGRRDRSSELFSIIMFDVWHRRYVENEDLPWSMEAGNLSA